MENHYLPPDAWTFAQHQYQYAQQEPQQESYINSTAISPEPEMEVDWDQWMQESSRAVDQPIWGSAFGAMSQQQMGPMKSPSMANLDAIWFDQQPRDPTISSTSSPMGDELDELEQILFSSPESSQQTYTSTPTSSWTNTHSPSSPDQHLSPYAPDLHLGLDIGLDLLSTSILNTAGEASPTHNSVAQATPSSSSETAYACTDCPKTFSKRHEYNRHVKIHNPSVVCPYHSLGCTKRTARNRDMDRHVEVHHPNPPPAAASSSTHQDHSQSRSRHFCFVRGCVAVREGFSRRDNLGRHLKNVHGLRLGQQG